MKAPAALVGLVCWLAACGRGFDPPQLPAADARPLASAGTGSSYPLGTAITLDGSASYDPDGELAAYRWTVTARPGGAGGAVPADPGVAVTTFLPDAYGFYELALTVTDGDGLSDQDRVTVEVTGQLTNVNAGPDATARWLATVQLAGSVTALPGLSPTYAWALVARPIGSAATLAGELGPNPTFRADAEGTYVLALTGKVGTETLTDTVTVVASADERPLTGTIVSYAYSRSLDRLVFVRDVGHAELVVMDPVTGVQAVLDAGITGPTTISLDPAEERVAVGAPGKVAILTLAPLHLDRVFDVPITPNRVVFAADSRVHCLPTDGQLAPIASLDLATGVVVETPSAARFPYGVRDQPGRLMYVVDGAAPEIYVYDLTVSPIAVARQATIPTLMPPVFAGETGEWVVTGSGVVVDRSNTPTAIANVQTQVVAAADSTARDELAVIDTVQLRLHLDRFSFPRTLAAPLPSYGGVKVTGRLVAYRGDRTKLYIVGGTPAGDVLVVVPL